MTRLQIVVDLRSVSLESTRFQIGINVEFWSGSQGDLFVFDRHCRNGKDADEEEEEEEDFFEQISVLLSSRVRI